MPDPRRTPLSEWTSALRLIPLPAWFATLDGQVAAINDRWLHVTGQTSEAAQGMGWLHAIEPTERAGLMDDWLGVRAGAGAMRRLVRVQTEQSPCWMQINVDAAPADDPQGWICTLTDVDVEVRRLEQARATADQLRLLGERQQLGWFAWDVGAGMTVYRPGLSEVLGTVVDDSKADGLHRAVLASAAPHDRDGVQRALHALVTGTSNSEAVQYRAAYPLGSERFLELQAWSTDDGSAPTIVGSVTDVTSDVRDLQQRMGRRELEDIGATTGAIAHDLANSLASIESLLRLASRPDSSTAETDERLARATTQAHQAGRLTQQILARVRRADRRREPIDLATVARDTCSAVAAALEGGIDLTLELNPAPLVMGQSADLHQLLLNLVTNAVQAIAESERPIGQVAVCIRKATRDEVDALPESGVRDATVVVVTDDGPGMSDEIVAHAFEPGFSTKRTYGGLGVGLARVRTIVLDHGGEVIVETRPGHGTSFTIIFPGSAPARAAAAAGPAVPARRVSGRRVLVVDDEPAICEFLTAMLRDEGCEVTPFSNAWRARRHIVAHAADIDVLIADLAMPGCSGADLVEALHRANGVARSIITTGFVDERTEARLRASGVSAVLLKPVAFDDLLAELHLDEGD